MKAALLLVNRPDYLKSGYPNPGYLMLLPSNRHRTCSRSVLSGFQRPPSGHHGHFFYRLLSCQKHRVPFSEDSACRMTACNSSAEVLTARLYFSISRSMSSSFCSRMPVRVLISFLTTQAVPIEMPGETPVPFIF